MTKIKLTEDKLHKIIAESVKKVLAEIGDTEKGQFALGAVRGRATAKPSYQNNKYGNLKAREKQRKIASDAADSAWNNRREQDVYKQNAMSDAEQAGYNYGFKKGEIK